MARWRYITEEQAQEAQQSRPEASTGDELLDIFEVVKGVVHPYVGKDVVLRAIEAPPRWSVRILDEPIPQITYEVGELVVVMNGELVELKSGTLVAFLPPNYREVADGS